MVFFTLLMADAFNRTIIELKPPGAEFAVRAGLAFNRTIIELKPLYTHPSRGMEVSF